MFERVAVAVDGSENSMRAANIAIDMAVKNTASLFVIHVIPTTVYTEMSPPGMLTAGSAPVQMFDKAKKEAESFMKQIVDNAEGQGLKVRAEIIENVPSVVDTLVDYMQEWRVDLAVVGTRGLSGLRKMLLGSVSSALVSRAPCSVLVVR